MSELESYVLQRAAVLELQYPFTKEELTNSFRKMAFRVHPDMGGKPEQFIKVKTAYDELLVVIPDESTDTKKHTSDGHLFLALGKGLGDLVNSDDCPECRGAGYTVTTHTHTYYEVVCPNCEGQGYVWTRKRFSLFDFNFSGMEKCTRCQGHGGFKGHSAGFTSTHYCYHCNGTGQIEIPNPALPKGRVPTKEPNIDKRPRKQYCQCGALLRHNGTCWRCSGLVGVSTKEATK